MQPVDDIALFFKDGQGALLNGSVTAVAAAGAIPAKAARPPTEGAGKRHHGNCQPVLALAVSAQTRPK